MRLSRVVAVDAIGTLISELRRRGFRVVGPTRRDGAIVHDELRGIDDLPRGWTDVQEAGRYRLEPRDDDALFGYAVGPHTWKRELLPPRHLLWEAAREGDTRFEVREPASDATRTAFLGVRGCELAAIAVQDRVFLGGLVRDTVYGTRREDVALIAVDCSSPAATCFCASMGTGPDAGDGADLAITELLDGAPHELLVRAGTPLGDELLAVLGGRDATTADHERADAAHRAALEAITRSVDADDVHDALLGALEDPHWHAVGERCLTCGNCTLVCPTCFCTQVEDLTDLEGEVARRERRWDTCFSLAFSQVGPSSVRTAAASRYRQWMTHKLATWVDQFGTSGCVGCGRCITWCPVGIDITEEAAHFTRATEVTT